MGIEGMSKLYLAASFAFLVGCFPVPNFEFRVHCSSGFDTGFLPVAGVSDGVIRYKFDKGGSTHYRKMESGEECESEVRVRRD